MDKIYLNDVRIYAYHGCLSEEAIIGSDYRVDMWVEANLNKAKKNDSLKDTVDYVFLLRNPTACNIDIAKSFRSDTPTPCINGTNSVFSKADKTGIRLYA